MKKLLFVVNVDWFFVSHRLPVAIAAQEAGFEVHVAAGITDKLLFLESYGLTVHALSLRRAGVGVLSTIKTAYDLLHIINLVKPNVIHLVSVKPVLIGGVVARLMRVPALVSAVSGLGYVFTAQGLNARLRKRLIMFPYGWALRHPNQIVIFQNKDDRDTLMPAIGFASQKVELIRGSGVDLIRFSMKPEPTGKPIVLLPARLLADKGVFEFIEAARMIRKKGVAARFVLAGLVDIANPTSVGHMQLENWIAEGVIEYWGYRPDMPNVLACASIVVLPSYREGMPKALQEAAACGRAVITTDVPGCRDAIQPSLTGLLVPPREPCALAEAIELLLSDPVKRKAMGLAGRRLAEQEFDVHSVANKHLDVYRRLMT
jgi:glycosyltransferase involved in cell wall biosynthesis